MKKAIRLLNVRGRREWRAWLRDHHASTPEIWLVFHKKHTGTTTISYDAAVEEALCYGWIDSLARRLDEDRFALKFTPRRPDSRWSTINRRRYSDLKARGRLAASGRERPPTMRSYEAKPHLNTELTPDLERVLRASAKAWANFEQLPPSARRYTIGWVSLAKREETRERRLREVIRVLAAGKRLGLK